MTIEHKHGPSGHGFAIKTSGDGLAEGQFEGWASTFGGSPDSYNDVVARGAFTNTIKRKGRVFPLDWSHDITTPIGIVEAVEKDRGLWVKGTLALDVQRGREAWSLLKLGAIGAMSIGYLTINSTHAHEGHRILTEIDLFEVSLVQHPANEAAIVERVKQDPQQLRALLSALQGARLAAESAELQSLLKGLKQLR